MRPRADVAAAGPPPMGGRLVRDGDDMRFVPRFSFVDGTTYTIVVEGVTAAVLVRPRQGRPAATEVLDIYPTTTKVPRNLLRLYIWFLGPMSEGCAESHVRLIDADGKAMIGALLPAENELWDAARRRLTLLLDPARIKRGLAGHRLAGYLLQFGASFRLVVDEGFRHALGMPLRSGAERRYDVGGEECSRVEPGSWALSVPPSHTFEPLEVFFERPLNRGLLGPCVYVVAPNGRAIDGTGEVGLEERSWRLAPQAVSAVGPHELVVDPVLEDPAGNSISRVFDRDLTRHEDEPREARPATVTFRTQSDGQTKRLLQGKFHSPVGPAPPPLG